MNLAWGSILACALVVAVVALVGAPKPLNAYALVPLVAGGTIVYAYHPWSLLPMPPLFTGHIAAMYVCWCLMVSGSVIQALGRSSSSLSRKNFHIAHGVAQTSACVAGLVGYYCIYANHAKFGQSQFGFDKGNPWQKTYHALFGYVVLGAMLLQAATGWLKHFGLQNGKLKFMYHSNFGVAILIATACQIVLVLPTFPFLVGKKNNVTNFLLALSSVGAFFAARTKWSKAREVADAYLRIDDPEPAA